MVSAREAALLSVAGAIETLGDPWYLAVAEGAVTHSSEETAIWHAECENYSRMLLDYGSSYEAGFLRAKDEDILNVSASGGDCQYDKVLVIAGGSPTAPQQFDDTAINAAGDVLTVPGHTLANGERMQFRKDAGVAAMFGPAEQQFYYAGNVSGDDFQVYSDEGLTSLVDLTAVTGGDTFDLIYAKGELYLVQTVAVTLVGDGASQPITQRLAVQFGSYGAGV